MATTSVYNLRYRELTDTPDIAAGTQDLAEDVETELVRIDGDVAALVQPYRATITLTANGAIDFTSIPTNLSALHLYWTLRSTDTGFQTQSIYLRINNISAGSVYRSQNSQASGTGTTVAAKTGATEGSRGYVGLIATDGAAAGAFASGTIRFGGWNSPHSGFLGWTYDSVVASFDTTLWHSTGGGTLATAGPYNRITLYPEAGTWKAGSQATLVGWV